eukprot:CAMPEP_0206635392 /NCGR_PEP_ID=MMETSP0325_2-20121206/70540_1 /ASSEMBLY_ACC=CAM_ASM_000347 /TAXON_ID=2866 /ORGANISM="Crypthecodinium cohnii, Strain Seligo" /LENGTH=200 /DNA_ID=CAMNT_0054161231 /DNA_START=177 /DNA_END=774 /DNA_ORIENTATION=-
MGYLEPAPMVGSMSLTAVCTCLLTSSCCPRYTRTALYMSLASTSSPIWQSVLGAWFLLGVPMVIYAGIGAAFRVESHLTKYILYLLGTLGVVVGWGVVFIKYGNSCITIQSDTPSNYGITQSTPSLVCGVASVMVIFWVVAAACTLLGATYIAWSMKAYIRSRTETELLRYQEPWQVAQVLAQDLAQEKARLMEEASKRS